jgi:hypothetical protein
MVGGGSEGTACTKRAAILNREIGSALYSGLANVCFRPIAVDTNGPWAKLFLDACRAGSAIPD